MKKALLFSLLSAGVMYASNEAPIQAPVEQEPVATEEILAAEEVLPTDDLALPTEEAAVADAPVAPEVEEVK